MQRMARAKDDRCNHWLGMEWETKGRTLEDGRVGAVVKSRREGGQEPGDQSRASC
jgi:hypothetical protein